MFDKLTFSGRNIYGILLTNMTKYDKIYRKEVIMDIQNMDLSITTIRVSECMLNQSADIVAVDEDGNEE